GPEILLAIESQHRRNESITWRFEEARLPAKRRCRVAECRNCMSAIVLAVTPGAHTVFPGFAPVNRAQSYDDAARCECGCPVRILYKRASFQDVITADVVVYASGRASHRRRQQIHLGRMQVATRGIATQCPARAAGRFPGRQPK